jgi:hypothetical protein
MNFKVILIFATAILAGCASGPTLYQSTPGPHGVKLDGNQSVFSGNTETTSMRAYHFSKLAAIENCYQKRMLTFLTETSTLMKDEGDKQRPESTTTFHCAPRVQTLKEALQMVQMESTPALRKAMQDELGGVIINEVVKGGVFEKGDIIVMVGNMRVANERSLIDQLMFSTEKMTRANLKIVRAGRVRALNAGVVDISQKMLELNFFDVQKACMQMKKGEPAVPLCQKTRTDWEKQIPI